MNGLTRQRTVRSAALTALCVGVMGGGGALVVGSAASAQDPPGNNGTVKVDDRPIDRIPNNKPHVGCVFRVDFYGFDKDVGDATVTFEMQAPTKDVGLSVDGDTSPDIGEDAAGGGTDLDAAVTYTLSFDGDPQPQQGFHVKLTVDPPGSIGAEVKHKVFWVEDCPLPPTETPPTETPPTETPPTETPPTETTEPPPTETPPTETTEPPPTETPPTETTEAPPTQPPPTEIAAGVGGADDESGSMNWWPAAGLIGSGALLAGGTALALRRRGDH